MQTGNNYCKQKTIKMDKYKNKYLIPSARLKNWNYGNEGSYFVTICTKNRLHYFGEIYNGEMQLNKIGELVISEWLQTFKLRSDMALELGEFIVMPNHFHGIIIIGNNEYNSTVNFQPDEIKFESQSKNLASIIRGFKSAVTTKVKKNCYNNDLMHVHCQDPKHCVSKVWQPRFHDHIIRDENSFERIQNYIVNNPKNWKEDKFFSA